MSAESAQHGAHKGERSGLWLSRLGSAFWHALFYFIGGIVLGVTLTTWVAPSLEHNHPLLARVAEHLGMGLIVAAFSVIVYETGAHLKGVVNLATRLTSVIEERIPQVRKGMARDAIDQVLRELLVGDNQIKPHVWEAMARCKELMKALSELENSRIWAHEQYVEFISFLLKYVVENAQALKSLGHPEKPSEYFYSMPTSPEATCFILSNQMKALGPGDRYDVISDLTSWENHQLGDFLDSTLAVIEKDGVKVVRIFNMRHLNDRNFERRKAREILTDHVKHSNDLGFTENDTPRYRVLVITEKELAQETSDAYREQIRRAHFGIFTPHGNHRLRVQVPNPDLSRLILANKPEEVRRDYDLFKRALLIARPVVNISDIETILDDVGLK